MYLNNNIVKEDKYLFVYLAIVQIYSFNPFLVVEINLKIHNLLFYIQFYTFVCC